MVRNDFLNYSSKNGVQGGFFVIGTFRYLLFSRCSISIWKILQNGMTTSPTEQNGKRSVLPAHTGHDCKENQNVRRKSHRLCCYHCGGETIVNAVRSRMTACAGFSHWQVKVNAEEFERILDQVYVNPEKQRAS